MKQKYAVFITYQDDPRGEIYEFDCLQKAQEYAKTRKELYHMIFGQNSIQSRLFQPNITIEPLQQLKKKPRQNDNELNERMTKDILRRMEKSYLRQTRRNCSKQDQDIIRCYEQSRLLHSLYSCLVEEDDERLRATVQNLADNILNDDVMPTLVDIGYVF